MGIEQNDTSAFSWFQKSSEQDNCCGQFYLGYCYYNGKGVDCDFNKAFELFTKSAEQNCDLGQFGLGNCYYDGYGDLEKDYIKAVDWYTKSAEQGNALAQYSLGYCYDNQIEYSDAEKDILDYIPRNMDLAIEWYKKSASANPREHLNFPTDRLNALGVSW